MLGSDHDMIQGCQAGTISVFIGSATVSIDTVPELALLSVPYLMNDYDQYQEVLQSTWKAWFQPYYQKNGLQLLTWRSDYDGCLVSTVPVHTRKDLQNINLRTMKNRYRENYWAGLGVNVFSLTYDEIAYYLQTEHTSYDQILDQMDQDDSISSEDKQMIISSVLNGRWFSSALDARYNNKNLWE